MQEELNSRPSLRVPGSSSPIGLAVTGSWCRRAVPVPTLQDLQAWGGMCDAETTWEASPSGAAHIPSFPCCWAGAMGRP